MSLYGIDADDMFDEIDRRKKAEAQRDELAALLRGLRVELADRVPMNCNERFSAVNRIDAALAKVNP